MSGWIWTYTIIKEKIDRKEKCPNKNAAAELKVVKFFNSWCETNQTKKRETIAKKKSKKNERLSNIYRINGCRADISSDKINIYCSWDSNREYLFSIHWIFFCFRFTHSIAMRIHSCETVIQYVFCVFSLRECMCVCLFCAWLHMDCLIYSIFNVAFDLGASSMLFFSALVFKEVSNIVLVS